MTKDLVLAALKKSNEYISGERISAALGVSRAAVNAAIKSLREDGYEILSSTNRGYLFVSSPDKLSFGEMLSVLPEGRASRVLCLESVDSTNNHLKALAHQGVPNGQVVIANSQTAGKGRLGRSFTSMPDKGIYMSLLFRPDCSPSKISNITAWTAVAVSRAIERTCGIRTGIKWVNDLVVENKKVCGILTEMSVEAETGSIQHVVIGIGINVSHEAEDFPQDIREIAASLSMFTDKKISRASLAGAVIEELDKMAKDWPSGASEYLGAYRSCCVSTGKEVYLIKNGERIDAFSETVDENFALVVRFKDGSREAVSSGEVSVRGLYGYI